MLFRSGQSTLKGQYTSRNEKLGSEKKSVFVVPSSISLLLSFASQALEPCTWRVSVSSHHAPMVSYGSRVACCGAETALLGSAGDARVQVSPG